MIAVRESPSLVLHSLTGSRRHVGRDQHREAVGKGKVFWHYLDRRLEAAWAKRKWRRCQLSSNHGLHSW